MGVTVLPAAFNAMPASWSDMTGNRMTRAKNRSLAAAALRNPAKPSVVREAIRAGCTWVDIQNPGPSEIADLARKYGFHEKVLEDLVSPRHQRNKLERHPKHLFVILRFPRLAASGPARPRTQVSLLLGRDYLVTVHDGSLDALEQVWSACQADPAILDKGPSVLVYRLVDALVDGLFPLLEELTTELVEIEEAVFDEKVEVIRSLSALRRSTHYLRTSILPLKRVVAELSTELWGNDKELLVYLKDVNDHLEKVAENLEELRETVEIYKDTDFLLSTAKTNKILAVLTIIFTLSIPVTVLGTLYGMNIALPGGVDAGPWTFLGPYTTFILIFALGVVAPTVAMLWVFVRLGWIGRLSRP